MKKYLKPIFIILFNTLILLAVIEFGLQMFYPQKLTTIAFQHNDDYLISLKSNITKQFVRNPTNGGDTIIWKTNANSFRGDELRESDFRIIVYGDSNIQARFSRNENTFCSKLESYLKEKTLKDIEVINAGLVGAGPDQNLIRFNIDKTKLKPDLVLLHIFAENDYGDIVKNRLFNIGPTGNLLTNEFRFEKDPILIEWENKNKRRLRFFDAIEKFQLKKPNKITKDEYINLLVQLNKEDYQNYLLNRSKTKSHFKDFYDLDLATQANTPAAKLKKKFMYQVLQAFRDSATSANIPLLVLVQPSTFDLTKNAKINAEDIRERFPSYKPKNLSSFIENDCNELEISVHNLFDDFVENDPSALFFKKGDNHWNDVGQDLAAQKTSIKLLTLIQDTIK